MTHPDGFHLRASRALRVFKSVWFRKFARKERIEDALLCEAVKRAMIGQIDADLGGGLIKQRVAHSGAGKAGGYRTVVLFRADTRAVFVFGFAKNDRANIGTDEERAFKRAAKLVLALTEEQIDAEVACERLTEVDCDDENL